MQLIELKKAETLSQNNQLNERYNQLSFMLEELRLKSLPEEIISIINEKIDQVNNSPLEGKERCKLIRTQLWAIIRLVEKKLKIVPKNYYRNYWMLVGMSAFGIPLGVAFGTSLHNMGFIGIGLPIGLAIGIAIGTGMDQKAQTEGRQLSIEAKY
ncbi:MAG: hypothetical protein JST06_11335 [Bacteroidetes bacterium]|nr:hypothetical protein [Bacteroidota bacterium]